MEDIVQAYYKNIQDIFDGWKSDGVVKQESESPFVYDGVVYPEEWFRQENTQYPLFSRPLFLLKEAYSSNKNDWDETEWIKGDYHTKIYSKTFKRILQWSYCIWGKELPTEYKWDDEIFKKIAIINIKKYGGINPSNNNNLRDHAIKHANSIYKQIEIIQPTVIICGYTCWLLDMVFSNAEKCQKCIRQTKNPEYIYKTDINGAKVMVIDFYHPAAIKSDNELLEKLSRIRDGEHIIFDHSEKGTSTLANVAPTPYN